VSASSYLSAARSVITVRLGWPSPFVCFVLIDTALRLIAQLSPPAHTLWPLRLRFLNAETGEAEWHTAAYIPVVRKGKEPGAGRRAQLRRSALLQRVLYLVFRSAIAASHMGVKVRLGERELLAFPRLLLYICDIPEEKAILCLKSGACMRPCSMCDVHVKLAGAPAALNAKDRDARKGLERQVESANLASARKNPSRRLMLEKTDSAHSVMPALAGMAGLSTEPFLMYKMIGVDTLHVRFLGGPSLLPSLMYRICSL